MIVQGLEQNIYYTNNPIYVRVSDLIDTKYIDIKYTVDATIKIYRHYPSLSNEVLIDIATVVRSFICRNAMTNNDYTTPISNYNNLLLINIEIIDTKNNLTVSSINHSKKFIRGGKVGSYNNISPTINTVLAPIDKIPYWPDYPISINYIDSNNEAKQGLTYGSNFPFFPRIVKQQERTDKGVYVKFLNSLGGFSYWLFENSEIKLKSKNIGTYITPSIGGDIINDMGHEVTSEQNLETVVIAEYLPLMQDLIMSPEVYVYKGNYDWLRVTLDNNSVSEKLFKRVYDVSISLNLYNNYTPTTLI